MKHIKIINYDALTYSGNLNNVKSIQDNPNYSFVKGKSKMESCWSILLMNVMCK